MMEIWKLLGGLVTLVALILWVRWLVKPQPKAMWPYREGFLRPALLYIIPLFLMAFTVLGMLSFAKSLGSPQWVSQYMGGIPMYIGLAISGIGLLRPLLGIPTPPFLVPRWIREEDRRRRRIKRVEREHRWQNPTVKQAEIRSTILRTVVTAGVFVIGVVGYIAADTFLF